jgi:hypothetical protein
MDEVQLAEALRLVTAGMSYRAVAKQFNVSRDYLRARFQLKPLKRDAQKHRQHLSEEQEASLVSWALLQARLGWAPTHAQFRVFAQLVIGLSGGEDLIGDRWHRRLFRRWPQLKTLRATGMDYLRVNGASRENIQEFFSRLGSPELSAIPPEHRWNFDEIGGQIGLGDSPWVIGPGALKEIFSLDTSRGEWVTSLEAISATGEALPPLVIFKGKAVQQQWFTTQPDEEDFKKWSFAASQKGWTTNEIALRWLKEVFLPLTAPRDPQQWRHLILDGHGSHTQEDFMLACFKARVWIDFLPAHTSQVL